MRILRISFLFLVFFLITAPFSSASVTSMTTFDVENKAPEIKFSELKGNELEIVVFDPNGYNDITDDGYVKVVLPDKSEKFALIQEADGERIKYLLVIDYEIKNEDIIDIEVSDGNNIIKGAVSVNKENQKQGITSITGLFGSETENKEQPQKLADIFKKIADFIINIFK